MIVGLVTSQNLKCVVCVFIYMCVCQYYRMYAVFIYSSRPRTSISLGTCFLNEDISFLFQLLPKMASWGFAPDPGGWMRREVPREHGSPRTRVFSVVLGEVSADSSDQRRDELGEAAEVSGEEGVAVLRLRRHRPQVVQGCPGHAHWVHDDAWWLVEGRNRVEARTKTETGASLFVFRPRTLALCDLCRASDVVVRLAVCQHDQEVAARCWPPIGQKKHRSVLLRPRLWPQ